MISPFEVDTGTQTFSNLEGKDPPKEKERNQDWHEEQEKEGGKEERRKGRKLRKGRRTRRERPKNRMKTVSRTQRNFDGMLSKRPRRQVSPHAIPISFFSRSTGFTISLRPFRIWTRRSKMPIPRSCRLRAGHQFHIYSMMHYIYIYTIYIIPWDICWLYMYRVSKPLLQLDLTNSGHRKCVRSCCKSLMPKFRSSWRSVRSFSDPWTQTSRTQQYRGINGLKFNLTTWDI